MDEETLRLDTAATPQFIGAMTEMVWSQIGISFPSISSFYPRQFLKFPILQLTIGIENVAQDLETFSRHAGRTTVTTDDVLLITRRNEALYGIMRDFVEKEQVAAPKGKSKAVKGKGRAKK